MHHSRHLYPFRTVKLTFAGLSMCSQVIKAEIPATPVDYVGTSVGAQLKKYSLSTSNTYLP